MAEVHARSGCQGRDSFVIVRPLASSLLAASLAMIGACSSRTEVAGDSARVDAAMSIDASGDAPSIDAAMAVDAPSIDARSVDAVAASDAPSIDARSPSDAALESSTNRDAGCPCPQGDACMDPGAILCAPHPDYPCASTDGWYAFCTATGWDCRFTTPPLC
jgi:hypothetical protein